MLRADCCFMMLPLSPTMGMRMSRRSARWLYVCTGKTEAVNDLGSALGVFVVVTSCTDQQRFTDMTRSR